MDSVLMMGLLIPMAIKDIMQKRLSLLWMLIWGIAGAVRNIIWKDWRLEDVLTGALIGGVMILFSGRKRSLGSGDGVLFLAAGLICGWERCLLLLAGSLLLCCPVSLFLKIVKKKSGDYEIPFAPFVAAAWLCQILWLIRG